MNYRRYTFFTGLSLAFTSLIAILNPVMHTQTVISPMPLLMLIPVALLLHFGIIIPVLLFFAWNPGLFRGDLNIPDRTFFLFGVTAVLNAIDFIFGWESGVRNQGLSYMYGVSLANFVWMAMLGSLIFRRRRRRPSFLTNLSFHWALFAWLFWHAFPKFTQMP